MQEGYKPNEEELNTSEENELRGDELKLDRWGRGERVEVVSVPLMWKSIESILSEYLSGEELDKAMKKISDTLDSSKSFVDFSKKYEDLYHGHSVHASSFPRRGGWDEAFLSVRQGFLPIFAHYFADKQGYRNMDQYLEEKHGAKRVD